MSVVGLLPVTDALALLGAAYLFLQAREVWRKTRLLFAEIETAAARAEQASRPAAAPGAHPAHSNGT